MKATIDGVEIDGTPEEIAAFVKLSKRVDGLAERITQDPPVRLGPKAPPHWQEAKELEERMLKLIKDSLARIPNVNITPHGRMCTGGMRFC